MFADTQGTRVQALIWSNDLDFYENTFEPYKRYQISNANLIYTEPRFQLDSYEYSWTLSKLTLIEPFQDETSTTLTCNFTFTPFSDLHKYADEERDINVRGIVIKCFPSQKMKQGQEPSSKRDEKLLILTLWNYINENEGNTLDQIVESGPMIFALRVKVTTFYGQSLSTSSSSAILINPPATDDLQLKNWSRAIVEIDDGTGSIATMISTPEIEKFMKVDYNEIKDAGENVSLLF
ncbi:unnamed protein product [Lactuca saligna]|uniref:Replication protein A OB domain-containing protein n=1 Tax=Lactuca saligna TaxID=75948 RepID=A0AA35UMA6_LACSI|nr:unnamed protein product [Lactuca saligna]